MALNRPQEFAEDESAGARLAATGAVQHAVAKNFPAGDAGAGPGAPVNTAQPTISGTAVQGQTLTCTPGTWTNSPTFAYQWLRNGAAIGGATASTYTIVAADVGQPIVCRVTASNAGGSGQADSAAVVPAASAAAPVNQSPPVISGTPSWVPMSARP